MIIQVKLSHIGIDILIDFLAVKYHFDLPLTPHFIHSVADYISTQDHLAPEPEGEVNQDLFDHVELIKHLF